MNPPEKSSASEKLAQDLESYSASVQSKALADRGRPLLPRWSAFAAALGSGLALTTAAEADIIYNSSHTSFSVGNGTNGGQIAIDPPVGVFSLVIRHTFSAFFGIRIGSAKVVHPNVTHGGGPYVAFLTNGNATGGLKRLSSGAKISAGVGPFQGIPGPLKHLDNRGAGINVGTWASHQSGFAGVRFATKSTPGANIFNGWIRLSWGGDSAGFPNTIVDDFAYDNTGAPIIAGQETNVPEPGSLLLTMLAAGSTGVLAWRKRRQAAAAAKAESPSEPTA